MDEELSLEPAPVRGSRIGRSKGGTARFAKLTGEERREVARKAAQARWSKARSLEGNGEYWASR